MCGATGWRGPICADTPDTLTGSSQNQIVKLVTSEPILTIPDSLFAYPCTLLHLPPDLEIWRGHSLLTTLSRENQFPVDTRLVARCKDRTDAVEGSQVMTCMDGEWDNPLPWCVKTSDRLDFDGETAV